MDFGNHLQEGECVTESMSDGLDEKDIGNLLIHYQTHFSMVVTSLKNRRVKVEGNMVVIVDVCKWT